MRNFVEIDGIELVADLALKINGTKIKSTTGTTLSFSGKFSKSGNYTFEFTATKDGKTVSFGKSDCRKRCTDQCVQNENTSA